MENVIICALYLTIGQLYLILMGLLSCMREMRNAYKILVGKP